MRQKLLLLVFLVPGLAAAYMAWITWRAQDEGKWIFSAFALVFLVPFVAGLLPRKSPPPQPESADTRFVPHWYLMLATLILLAVLVLGAVAALRRLFLG